MNTSFSILFDLTVRGPDGSPKETRSGHNLVMRSAIPDFNVPASNYSTIARFAAGQGLTVPNRRDSGAVTFSSVWIDAGTPFVVTASAGFFVAADAGRLLKLASGEELAISAYISATQVTAAAYPVAPTNAQIGTVWYDNQTALESIVTQWGTATTFTLASAVANVVTGTSGTASVVVTQTAQTAVATGGYNVSELGWTTSAGALVGRAVIAPVAVQVGDYITCTLTTTYTLDTAAHAVSAPGANGDFSGTSRFYGAASGNAASVLYSGGAQIYIMAGAADVSTIHSTALSASSIAGGAASISTVSTGYPSVSTKRASVSLASGSGSIITIALRDSGGSLAPWVHALTAPVSKTTLQTVTASFDLTMTRTLVN